MLMAEPIKKCDLHLIRVPNPPDGKGAEGCSGGNVESTAEVPPPLLVAL